MQSYPKHFLGWFWTVVGVLIGTGIALIPGALELRLEWDVPFGLGTTRIGVAALHALASFATIAAVGALIPVHMRLGLRQRRNHVTGLILVGAITLLLLTAIGIYYVADPSLGVLSSLIHWLLGLALLIPLFWHWMIGRNMHRQRTAKARQHHSRTLTDPFRPVI